MRDPQSMDDRGGRPQARPFGSSSLAALLAIGVFFLAIIIAGVLILRGDDDADSTEFGLGSGTATVTDDVETPAAGLTVPPTSTVETQESPGSRTQTTTPKIFPTLTPAPTHTPDPEVDEKPTTSPEATGSPEEVDEEPIEEIPPTPVKEPFAGDFGFLPPLQLPSGGASQSLTLDYQLVTSLASVPTSATVYEVVWRSYTESDVETMAVNLGIDGTVTAEGDGLFNVSDDTSHLFVSPTIIEYSAAPSGSGALPSADVAIDAAWTWFVALGPGGIEAGSAKVIAVEEDAGLSVVALTPAYPSPNLAPTPSARIKVSAGGVVEEARVVWPGDLYASDYGLRPALDLWEALRSGNAFLSADLSESGGGTATMNVTDVSIAYTVSGSPWDVQYIVPLVVFGGTATVNGVDVWVDAYVPAVYHQENPLG